MSLIDSQGQPLNSSQYAQIVGADSFRLTPATLAQRLSDGAWKPAKHLLMISSLIATALAKGNARIAISVPPRHGKSLLLSIYTPLWILDWNPAAKIMLTSYGAELAEEFSVMAREIARDKAHMLRFKLNRDKQQASQWRTTAGGSVYASGVGGSQTGRGADVLLVDDYIKNAKDASSQTIREDAWEWFTSTALTRIEPGGSCLVVATRWNLDDIIGRLKVRAAAQQNPDRPINEMAAQSFLDPSLQTDFDVGNWIFIELPALALENDPLNRKVGEPLWPERYDIPQLRSLKAILGAYFWASVFQQNPVPKASGGFTRDQLAVIDKCPSPASLRILRSWDLAASEDGGDYTVGTLIAEDDNFGLTYILDVIRVQYSSGQVETLVIDTANNDGHDVAIHMEQEPGSAGKTVIDSFAKKLKGFKFSGKRSTGPKHIRAQQFFAAAENGTVRLLRGKWNSIFLDECELFPSVDHDDQVDATSAGYNKLNEKRYKGVVWGRLTGTNPKSQLQAASPAQGAPKAKKLSKGSLVQGCVW